jgi:hypothetical protein
LPVGLTIIESMTCLQIAGTVIQLIGVITTLLGVGYLWNQLSRLLASLAAQIKQIPRRGTRPAPQVAAALGGHGGLVATARPADTSNRLLNIEKQLAEMPGQIYGEIDAVEAAFDEKLAALEEAVKTHDTTATWPIWLTLGGLGVEVIGYIVSLIGQLSS